jgi:exosortase J
LLLGHLFNLIRLCALVVYYRVAVGYTVLEHAARQADYVIGALLFCAAASLLWIVFRKEGTAHVPSIAKEAISASDWETTYWRAIALALLVLVAMVSAVSAMLISSEKLAFAMRRGEISATELNSRMPTQVGAYRLVRAWQQKQAGNLVLETAAFEKGQSGEIEIGIWLAASEHSIQESLMTHGENPKLRAIAQFSTAARRTVPFSMALYDDGITDTLTGDTYCSPSACQLGSYKPRDGVHLAIVKTLEQTPPGKRVAPIFFKLQVPHTDAGSESVYKALSIECEDFLSHLDFTQLSQNFQ